MLKPEDFDKHRLMRDTNPPQYAFVNGEFQVVDIEVRHNWYETLNGWGFEPEPVSIIDKQIYIYQAITSIQQPIPYTFIVKHVIGNTDWTVFIPDYPNLLAFLKIVRPLTLPEAHL